MSYDYDDDKTPVMAMPIGGDGDMTCSLEDTKIWHELKRILADVLFKMPESDFKTKLVRFMGRHWSGIAPRATEFASMVSLMHAVAAKRDEYKKLLDIPVKPRVDRHK